MCDMFKILLIFLVFITQGFAKTVVPREVPEAMKVSVIIPCAGFHFKHLHSLLTFYKHQTSLPDEIVISLSSVEEITGSEIDALENTPWPFSVKILRFLGKKSAGLNRNLASDASSGDILLYQDADDVPHPQRVQIVKHIFENYYVDHLMHNFVFSDQSESTLYDIDQISILAFDRYDEIEKSPIFFEHIHNGNVGCLRKVFAAMQWEDVRSLEFDLDKQFNKSAYQKFANTALLPYPLVVYRRELSTFLHYFPNLHSL